MRIEAREDIVDEKNALNTPPPIPQEKHKEVPQTKAEQK